MPRYWSKIINIHLVPPSINIHQIFSRKNAIEYVITKDNLNWLNKALNRKFHPLLKLFKLTIEYMKEI